MVVFLIGIEQDFSRAIRIVHVRVREIVRRRERERLGERERDVAEHLGEIGNGDDRLTLTPPWVERERERGREM